MNAGGRMVVAVLGALGIAGCGGPAGGSAGPVPAQGYVVYVAAESADLVARLRFDAEGLRVERQRPVGLKPADLDGPHGLATSPDGRYYYVSIAHGTPFGTLWKLSADTEEVIERTTLGLFPATVDVTPDGQFGFVSNFNLHGDHVPSSISKVHLPTMAEVARTETCVMPHGSRINRQGTRHYSACMMDELLVEIDVGTAAVSRLFSVAPGAEGVVRPGDRRAGAHRGSHDAHDAAADVCSPTWAQPAPEGDRVYVACNRSGEILEVDAQGWQVLRRFRTGQAPYNIEVTPDGRYLLATLRNRTAPGTEIIDLGTGRTVATVPSTTVLPHGLAITPDSRFAFVSVEGVGSEPGKVDVIDIRARRLIASAEVGQQAGGIAILPVR